MLAWMLLWLAVCDSSQDYSHKCVRKKKLFDKGFQNANIPAGEGLVHSLACF